MVLLQVRHLGRFSRVLRRGSRGGRPGGGGGTHFVRGRGAMGEKRRHAPRRPGLGLGKPKRSVRGRSGHTTNKVDRRTHSWGGGWDEGRRGDSNAMTTFPPGRPIFGHSTRKRIPDYYAPLPDNGRAVRPHRPNAPSRTPHI